MAKIIPAILPDVSPDTFGLLPPNSSLESPDSRVFWVKNKAPKKRSKGSRKGENKKRNRNPIELPNFAELAGAIGSQERIANYREFYTCFEEEEIPPTSDEPLVLALMSIMGDSLDCGPIVERKGQSKIDASDECN